MLLASGSPDDAAQLFEDAERRFAAMGFRPEAARATLLRGQALLRAGKRTLAAAALVDARDRFATMEARLWEGRATEELSRAAPGRVTGELTRTESRIADLVAEGRQNKEIASALFLSVATVEAHLTRTYRKLGIRSRAELTRLVTQGTIDLGSASGADTRANP